MRGIYAAIKYPSYIPVYLKYVWNDIASTVGIYKYPHHVIFIVGLPKSGTTWLYNILMELPGFNRRFNQLSKTVNADGILKTDWFNLPEDTFLTAPKRGYSIYREHSAYNKHNLKIITKYMDKLIFIYRDIRDVCISLYFHFKNDETSDGYHIVKNLSEEEGIDYTMQVIKDDFVPWIQAWMNAEELSTGKILQIKYENLWDNTRNELERIVNFYGFNVSESFYKTALKSKIKSTQNLRESLFKNSFSLKLSTARRGGSGGWKKYLSQKQKEQFKDFAGQLLINLNYEHDLDW